MNENGKDGNKGLPENVADQEGDERDPMIGAVASAKVLAYGFKWFEYHANQRISTFNFYLVVYSGMATAYSFLLKEKILAGSILLGLLMILVSILSWQLDIRNRQLIDIGEDIVTRSWASAGLDEGLNPIALSRRQQSEGLRFKQIFGMVFLVGGIVGLAALGYAIAAAG
jgi:hypothetical protein